MESIDTTISRRQFEYYILNISKSDVCSGFILDRDGDGYKLSRTQDSWMIWQASRQSLLNDGSS